MTQTSFLITIQRKHIVKNFTNLIFIGSVGESYINMGNKESFFEY